jgi:hypothetical protein
MNYQKVILLKILYVSTPYSVKSYKKHVTSVENNVNNNTPIKLIDITKTKMGTYRKKNAGIFLLIIKIYIYMYFLGWF